jgi:predicted Zn-dependent peptidase
MNGYSVKKLKNGIPLIMVPKEHISSVVVGLFVRAGSSFENDKTNGFAHFIEHMLHRNIKKEIHTERNVRFSDPHFLRSFDPFTNENYTAYILDVFHTDLNKAFEVCAKVIKGDGILVDGLDEEKKIVTAEIADKEKEDLHDIQQAIITEYYGEHPLSLPVTGKASNIKDISAKQLHEYFKERYVPENMVVVVSGKCDENEVESSFNALLPSFNTNARDRSGVNESRKPLVLSNSTMRVHETGDGQCDVLFKAPYVVDGVEQFPEIAFMRQFLEDYLDQVIREENGFGYYVDVSSKEHPGFVDLHIEASVTETNVVEYCKMLITSLRKVSEYVTEADIETAKDAYLKDLLIDNDYPRMIVKEIGRQGMLFGVEHIISKEQEAEIVKNITLADVSVFAERLTKQPHQLHIIGAVTEEAKTALTKEWE